MIFRQQILILQNGAPSSDQLTYFAQTPLTDNGVRLSHGMSEWYVEPSIGCVTYDPTRATQRLTHEPPVLLKILPSVHANDCSETNTIPGMTLVPYSYCEGAVFGSSQLPPCMVDGNMGNVNVHSQFAVPKTEPPSLAPCACNADDSTWWNAGRTGCIWSATPLLQSRHAGAPIPLSPVAGDPCSGSASLPHARWQLASVFWERSYATACAFGGLECACDRMLRPCGPGDPTRARDHISDPT